MEYPDYHNKIDSIFPTITEDEERAILVWVLKEIKNRSDNPDNHENFKASRERIYEVEKKALSKLKGVKIKEEKKGSQCSLCPRYESDVEQMVKINSNWQVCSECLHLVKDVINKE